MQTPINTDSYRTALVIKPSVWKQQQTNQPTFHKNSAQSKFKVTVKKTGANTHKKLYHISVSPSSNRVDISVVNGDVKQQQIPFH